MPRLLTLVLILLTTSPVLAQEQLADLSPPARAHLEAGLDHHQAERYEAALVEFRAGHQLDPSPIFLFAMAQAERLSGDCPSATIYYREFLITNPSKRHAAVAEKMLARCESALDSRPEPAPSPIPPTLQPSDLAITPPPPTTGAIDQRRRWYDDRVGLSLLGGGIASGAIGLAFFARAWTADNAAASATDYQTYRREADRARRDQNLALVGLGVGTGLVTGYLIRRYFKRSAAKPRTIAVGATGNTIQAIVSVEF